MNLNLEISLYALLLKSSVHHNMRSSVSASLVAERQLQCLEYNCCVRCLAKEEELLSINYSENYYLSHFFGD